MPVVEDVETPGAARRRGAGRGDRRRGDHAARSCWSPRWPTTTAPRRLRALLDGRVRLVPIPADRRHGGQAAGAGRRPLRRPAGQRRRRSPTLGRAARGGARPRSATPAAVLVADYGRGTTAAPDVRAALARRRAGRWSGTRTRAAPTRCPAPGWSPRTAPRRPGWPRPRSPADGRRAGRRRRPGRGADPALGRRRGRGDPRRARRAAVLRRGRADGGAGRAGRAAATPAAPATRSPPRRRSRWPTAR